MCNVNELGPTDELNCPLNSDWIIDEAAIKRACFDIHGELQKAERRCKRAREATTGHPYHTDTGRRLIKLETREIIIRQALQNAVISLDSAIKHLNEEPL